MRRILLTAAALAAAAVAVLIATLPAGSRSIAATPPSRTVWRGAVHVHSRLSDGAGDLAAIATAAAHAGLDFVVVTDHGDGTEPVTPPRYVGGVLCLSGVEISTDRGHYVALGLPPAPYPLGGTPEAVVEDVRRLGGFGIVAHADSAKRELAWPDTGLAVDGIEWLNGDSAWRDESRARLAAAALQAFFKPRATLTALLDRPAAALAAWDQATQTARVVGVAGADAHGGARREPGEADGGGAWEVGALSYETSFRAFSNHVGVRRPPSWDAARDAADLLDAIRAGRLYSSVEGLAGPASLSFTAVREDVAVSMGEVVAAGAVVALTARAPMPEGGVLVLLRQGREVARAETGSLVFSTRDAGAYRVEGRIAGREADEAPWLVSNPIYIGLPEAGSAPVPVTLAAAAPVAVGGWHVEHDPGSSGAVRAAAEGAVRFEYRLRAGGRASQYVAAAADLPDGAAVGGLAFTIAASTPTRVSVQLREQGSGDRRWRHSVYADLTPREIVLPLSAFAPVPGNPSAGSPGHPATLLVVADLVNLHPGAAGAVVLRDVRYGRIR